MSSLPTPPLLGALIDAWDEADEASRAQFADRLRPHLGRVDQELLDAETKARELGLHPETLVRMARNKRVPGARKIGRSWRFPAGEIDIRAATDTHIPEPAPARRGGPGDAATSAIRGA